MCVQRRTEQQEKIEHNKKVDVLLICVVHRWRKKANVKYWLKMKEKRKKNV